MTGVTEDRVREIVREETRGLNAFRKDVLQRFAKIGILLNRDLKVRDDAQQAVEQHLVGYDIPLADGSATSHALQLLRRAGFLGQHDVADIDSHNSSPSFGLDTRSVGDGAPGSVAPDADPGAQLAVPNEH